MKFSATLDKLAPALVKAQAEIKSIHKDASNPFFKSKFASYDKIVTEVRPILASVGLALIQGVEHPETVGGDLRTFNVTTTLLHESGEWIQTDVVMPLGADGGKLSPTQVAGAALTYGRRYGLSTILALSTDDDNDGNDTGKARKATAAPASDLQAGDVGPDQSRGASSRPVQATDPLKMPMGKQKGTPNRDIPSEQLLSALTWAQKNGKYREWQVQADAELARRELVQNATNELRAADDASLAELPF